jgi:hypothetical protein
LRQLSEDELGDAVPDRIGFGTGLAAESVWLLDQNLLARGADIDSVSVHGISSL